MVYQDLSLCDTVDVAGNLFMGREPMKSVSASRFSTGGQNARRRPGDAEGLGISIPDTRLLVRNLRRPASGHCHRRGGLTWKVLIMDEPTAALAVAEVEAVLG